MKLLDKLYPQQKTGTHIHALRVIQAATGAILGAYEAYEFISVPKRHTDRKNIFFLNHNLSIDISDIYCLCLTYAVQRSDFRVRIIN